MSNDLIDQVRSPIIYPNWMWVVGSLILLFIIVWIVFNIWRWWSSDISSVPELQSLDAAQRERYHEFLTSIHERYEQGEWNEAGASLAVAGLMRALGTERSGRDLEVATAEEVRALVPMWPQLADLLARCEAPSFDGANASDVTGNLDASNEASSIRVRVLMKQASAAIDA